MSSINQKISAEQSIELLIKCLMRFKHGLSELGLKHGLTAMQSMVIVLLIEPKPMNSFTKLFNCDASNVTGLVDGLEEKKLAARFPDIKDRRIKMVKLSPRGEALRKKLLNQMLKQPGLIDGRLSTEEQQTFFSLLKKIV